MTVRTGSELKQLFETGDHPNQQNFEDLIDSCLNDGDLVIQIPDGDNIFNVANADNLNDHFILQTNGDTIANATYIATHFMPVNEGRYYYGSAVHRYAFYDSDRVYISGASVGGGTTPGIDMLAPEGAAFLRLAVNASPTTERWLNLIVSPVPQGESAVFKAWTGREFLNSNLIPGLDLSLIHI